MTIELPNHPWWSLGQWVPNTQNGDQCQVYYETNEAYASGPLISEGTCATVIVMSEFVNKIDGVFKNAS